MRLAPNDSCTVVFSCWPQCGLFPAIGQPASLCDRRSDVGLLAPRYVRLMSLSGESAPILAERILLFSSGLLLKGSARPIRFTVLAPKPDVLASVKRSSVVIQSRHCLPKRNT